MNPKIVGVCTKCGAEGKIHGNGLCVKDYAEDWRKRTRAIQCRVEGCKSGCKARMMCNSHYSKYLRTKKAKNNRQEVARAIAKKENDRIVSLLQKNNQHHAAFLVLEDYKKNEVIDY